MTVSRFSVGLQLAELVTDNFFITQKRIFCGEK